MGAGYRIQAKAASDEGDIFIYEDVGPGFFGGVSAKQFAEDLKNLGAVKTINLHLNSSGGDVFDGLAMYRLLVEHKAKVVSFIDGLAASIASVIAMAGDEIRISEAGFLMIHDAWGVAMGNSGDMRTMADLLDNVTGSISDVYVKRTKKAGEKIRKWMADETWFNAEDAVSNGFADSLMENMQVAAHFDLKKHKFKNAPAEIVGRPRYDAAQARLAAQRAEIQHRKVKELQAA